MQTFCGLLMYFSPTITSSNSFERTATSGTSSSTTISQSSIPTTTLTPSSDCSNGSTYNSLFQNGREGNVPSSAGLTFTMLCSTGGLESNIASAYVYTFEDCIELCAGLNFWYGDKHCLGVSYNGANGSRPVNCWAHNQTALNSGTGNAAVLAA